MEISVTVIENDISIGITAFNPIAIAGDVSTSVMFVPVALTVGRALVNQLMGEFSKQ